MPHGTIAQRLLEAVTTADHWVERHKHLLWLLSIAIPVVGVGVTAPLALLQYRATLAAQAAATDASRAESDVRLLDQFSRLVDTAEGRSGYAYSPEFVAYSIQHPFAFRDATPTTTPGTLAPEGVQLHDAIAPTATFALPVGLAAQKAAIASLAYMACTYSTCLAIPARDALTQVESNIPILQDHTRRALEQIQHCSRPRA